MEGASASAGGNTHKPAATSELAAGNNKQLKKRTKTGCLTCRKRRIKCGEELPVCNNCTKSKRECGGYRPAVALRQSSADFHQQHDVFPGQCGSTTTPNYLQYPILGVAGGSHNVYDAGLRQPQIGFDSQHWANQQEPTLYGIPTEYEKSIQGWIPAREQPQNPQEFGIPPAPNQVQHHWQPPAPQYQNLLPQQNGRATGYHSRQYPVVSGDQYPPTIPDSLASDQIWIPQQHAPNQYELSQGLHASHFPSRGSSFSDDFQGGNVFRNDSPADQYPSAQIATPSVGFKQESTSPGQPPRLGLFDSANRLTSGTVGDGEQHNSQQLIQRTNFNAALSTLNIKSQPRATPPSLLDEQDEQDDEDEEDPWDVKQEVTDAESAPHHQSQHDLSTMLVRFATKNDRRSRNFTSFLDGPSILTTYRPSWKATPLNDEKVARIFCHFISVTGPCLSIYERQTSVPAIEFNNSSIPASQKTLWTYILPNAALHNEALLHAMLALSALHISKLQNTSPNPAIKHYTFAVARIGKLLGLPKRRHDIATLAANLLVGFYEVMFADHSRWNIHLSGARVLIMEFDFAGMTRTIRRMRSRARDNVAGRAASSFEELRHITGIPETLIDDKDWEINENLVSQLTGYSIQYDHQWQQKFPPKHPTSDFSARDVEDFKTKSDLYWWYCKQDIFQSMISGDPLLMPYRRWIYCPPRGQISRPEAPYATMDHLCLIMARLADFGGKDRPRKQRMIMAQGGQWRPPPNHFGPRKANLVPMSTSMYGFGTSQSQSVPLNTGQPSHDSAHNIGGSRHASQPGPSGSPTSSPPKVPQSGPSFYGMMPPPAEAVEMHSAFYRMNANMHDQAFHDLSKDEEPTHSQSLEQDTVAALNQHSEIVKAFDLFFHSLGPEYQPLPAISCVPVSTPFGPALQYRTYPIACIWAFYYVGRILIHRFHPHMPPAAMVASGVTAHLTSEFAQKVGRICAGLYYPQEYSLQTGNLNPNLGAALMESTFCLLFAAIQFQDAGQRGWTISKLRDIAHRTGWQTSATIAAACEVSWQRMGEAGKGPPYIPTMDRNNQDLRVNRLNRMHEGTDIKREEDDRDGNTGSGLPRYDRSSIHSHQSTRVHWALGVLSVEEDIKNLNLDG